mgnify:CR=1 FL=1
MLLLFYVWDRFRKNSNKSTYRNYSTVTDFIDNKNLFYRHKANIIIHHLTKHNKKKYYSSVEGIMKENNYFTIDLRNSILSISYEEKNIPPSRKS